MLLGSWGTLGHDVPQVVRGRCRENSPHLGITWPRAAHARHQALVSVVGGVRSSVADELFVVLEELGESTPLEEGSRHYGKGLWKLEPHELRDRPLPSSASPLLPVG